ncbi:hypothetical protein C7B76_15295 [filamentous cyanobacterium CCP2]|nr:hypothetical protein C7B76_15295 [filamentous cyanobacterium CCP2]
MSYRPPRQRPFGSQERALFRIYVNCALSLEHPRQLYTEYNLTYEELAYVAGCTTRTIERWMSQDEEPKLLKGVYLRRLGEFYFLLRHYHRIPLEVWDTVCPLNPTDRSILYPEPE